MRNPSPISVRGPLASCLHTHHDHGSHLSCRKMFSRPGNGKFVVNRASRIAKKSIHRCTLDKSATAVVPTSDQPTHFISSISTPILSHLPGINWLDWGNNNTIESYSRVPKNPSDHNLIIQYLYYLQGAHCNHQPSAAAIDPAPCIVA
jgi:hypothetical protein